MWIAGINRPLVGDPVGNNQVFNESLGNSNRLLVICACVYVRVSLAADSHPHLDVFALGISQLRDHISELTGPSVNSTLCRVSVFSNPISSEALATGTYRGPSTISLFSGELKFQEGKELEKETKQASS